MRVNLEDWKNGWFGIELAISAPEIDCLISLLRELEADPDQHFHISSDYKAAGGVGDIQVFVKSEDATDNLFLSGTALQPGDEI
jgi:hypothetical protein